MKRILVSAFLALCGAQLGASQDVSSEPRAPHVKKNPAHLPPVYQTPRIATNPYAESAERNPDRIDRSEVDAALLDAIRDLGRRIDSLAATQAMTLTSATDRDCGREAYAPPVRSYSIPPEPYTMSPFDGSSSASDGCTPLASYAMPPARYALERRRLLEPPILLRSRTRSLASPCAPAPAASYAAPYSDPCAPAVMSDEYRWDTSLIDRIRGRSVRQVGPYTIETVPGLFCTEVRVR